MEETLAEAKAEWPIDRNVPGNDNAPVIGHSPNALSLILYKDAFEKSTEVTPVLEKAKLPIVSNPSGSFSEIGTHELEEKALLLISIKWDNEDKSIFCKQEQPENEEFPIRSTDSGIFTFFNAGKDLKAAHPISFIVLGRTTSSKYDNVIIFPLRSW